MDSDPSAASAQDTLRTPNVETKTEDDGSGGDGAQRTPLGAEPKSDAVAQPPETAFQLSALHESMDNRPSVLDAEALMAISSPADLSPANLSPAFSSPANLSPVDSQASSFDMLDNSPVPSIGGGSSPKESGEEAEVEEEEEVFEGVEKSSPEVVAAPPMAAPSVTLEADVEIENVLVELKPAAVDKSLEVAAAPSSQNAPMPSLEPAVDVLTSADVAEIGYETQDELEGEEEEEAERRRNAGTIDGGDRQMDMDQFEREISRLQSLDDVELPATVTKLETKYGTRIFLVGTAHFSLDSQEDVSKTIHAVEPDVVMVELCDSRKHILSYDEEALQKPQTMNLATLSQYVKQAGVVRGITYLLLLNLSAHITKKLGMAPGGEFRRAFVETKKLQARKKTKIHLGDRPVHVTLKRALGMLSLWQKLQLCWTLMTDKLDISQEEVEKMKQKDMLETLLQELAKDYPILSQVFVHERDVWLAHALSISEKMAVRDAPYLTVNGTTHVLPSVVVGVVGMGHLPGILDEWRKMEESQLTEEEKHAILMGLIQVPPPSLATRLLSLGFRAAKISFLLWSCHKIYKWIYPS